MNPHAFSPAWRAGFSAGYKHSGRSYWRRCLVSILLSSILLGASAGLLWVALDVFLAQEAGPAIAKTIIGKFTSWNRVHRGAKP